MLKKSLILASLLISFTNAQTIEQIVNSVLEKNYKLKSLESAIDTSKQQIELSSKWQNPVLSFGATDIQLNDISKRDLEPMQAHFIGISQTIPLGDKLEISQKIAHDDYEISKLQLEDKRLELKSNIYELSYKIKLIEQRLSLFDEFKSNTLKLEKLLKELYKYGKANQTQILNTQILYKELNLKSQQLQTMLNSSNLKLEQLTYEKIEKINENLEIKNITLTKNIDTHPKILQLNQNIEKLNNISHLEKEKKNSDIKVNLAYFQRKAREDYINLSFAMPLSIRGSEDIKSRKAKYKSIEVKNSLEDMKLTFKNRIETLQQIIDDSKTTYKIIQKDILPKYFELQKVLESYNSFSSFKNIDTKSLIKNQNEIIKYKLNAINEKEKYFSALAKSHYFSKEL